MFIYFTNRSKEHTIPTHSVWHMGTVGADGRWVQKALQDAQYLGTRMEITVIYFQNDYCGGVDALSNVERTTS